MPTALVTGGAGFIGSNIVTALVERGDQVRVLDNLSTGSLENLADVSSEIELFEGSVLDRDLVEQAVAGVDVIFHEAALASVPASVERPLDSHAVCATGTVQMLDCARQAGVQRLVYAASSSAYGDQPTAAKRELDPLTPISPYGAAKLAGELYCQAFTATYGFETVGLRYFNVFGPRQDPGSPYSAVIPLFITAILEGRKLIVFGDGQQSRDFVYVGNVVQANLLAAEKPRVAGQVFNIGTGRSVTLLRLLAALRDLLETEFEVDFQPPRAGDVRDSLADITQARTQLGFDPDIEFEDGLRRSIEYYKQIAALR
ncbi:MAG: SDR family oxidoreductase [Pirellulales bacterium]|nr:SDR family oxidoreductase [Pirellulales bacterium]